MRYDTAREGRVFVIRLEDGENIQDSIEFFARKMKIDCAKLEFLGGVDKGSKLIVGPREGRADKIEPVTIVLEDMHEAFGNGTIFPNEKGEPVLHCHLTCGRAEKTLCGEIKQGVFVWHAMEVILTELLDCNSVRKKYRNTGFELLFPTQEFTDNEV